MFFLALHLNLKNLLPQDFGARGIFKRVTRVSTGKNIQSYVFQSTSQLLAGWDWQNIWIYSWSLRLLMLPVSDSQKGVMVWNGLGGSRQFFVSRTTTCMRQNQSNSILYLCVIKPWTYLHSFFGIHVRVVDPQFGEVRKFYWQYTWNTLAKCVLVRFLPKKKP